MCSCHSILECCVTFSGVKLSIRSFVLFHTACAENTHSAVSIFNNDHVEINKTF